MKNIIILDTTVGSMNIGDNIILNSIKSLLHDLLKESNVRIFPTRTIPFACYQLKTDSRVEYVKKADYKFVCGTNLLKTCMVHIVNQWNINILNCEPLIDSILVGVGSERGRIYLDPYTRMLYKKVLSHRYIHSVRDEQAKKILEDLEMKAINTGCPSLWGFNDAFCKSIPKKKTDKVVFTLHYGRKDILKDQLLIDILNRNYEKVYFFPQTPFDIDYLKMFSNIETITVLPSNLDAYTDLLMNNNIDYVGVRLHGGIYAMQHKKRSILIMVDERMRNMNKMHHLNGIDRNAIEELEKMINSQLETKIIIDLNSINIWLKQFNLTIK